MAHHGAVTCYRARSYHDKVNAVVRDLTIHVLVLTLVCALPVLAAVDDEWRNLYSLAVNATTVRDYPKADAIFSRALRDAELFGKTDPRVGTTLQSLASLQRLEKHLPEAEENARRAVSIFTGSVGDGSIDLGQSEFTLATIFMDEGKYEPALEAIKKALPIIELNLGSVDTATADAICVQGDVLRLLKQYASAETPLKRCADMRADSNGVNTAEFGEAANSLALVYQHLGQYKEADRYFTYAAKIREISLGITSPALADTLEAHALLLHQLGRDAEAKQKERMAAAIRARSGRK
jgi:tetratricopeptide (TPR) repeat protein